MKLFVDTSSSFPVIYSFVIWSHNVIVFGSIRIYNNMSNPAGYIDVIFGPMFSGKSTELLQKVNRYIIAQKNCLVVNYVGDCRYSSEDVVFTHDK